MAYAPPDYSYVMKDVVKILVVSGLLVAGMVVISLVIR